MSWSCLGTSRPCPNKEDHRLELTNEVLILLTVRPERFLKVRAFSNVDFPAPEAPIIAKTSPGLQYPLTKTEKCRIFENKVRKARNSK